MIEFDATGVKPLQLGPIPEGDYFLRVTDVDEGWSTKKDPQVIVHLEVDGGDYHGTKLRHYVTFLSPDSPAAGIAVHFLKCLGELHEGRLRIDPQTWIGRVIRGHVIQKKSETTGKVFNNLSSVESANGAGAPAPTPRPVTADDEVPF